VVGDCLAAEAAVGPEVEDLGHHLRPLGVGGEACLDLARLGSGGDRVRRGLGAVAVGWPPSAAEALQRPLAHPALGLSGELLALVLVEGLLQGDQETALGGRGVAGADRVVDVDADFAQLAVEEPGRDPVPREARGLVDDDGVEAPSRLVAGLLGERGPAGPVVLGARLLVENSQTT